MNKVAAVVYRRWADGKTMEIKFPLISGGGLADDEKRAREMAIEARPRGHRILSIHISYFLDLGELE